jgi:hypothetical protein
MSEMSDVRRDDLGRDTTMGDAGRDDSYGDVRGDTTTGDAGHDDSYGDVRGDTTTGDDGSMAQHGPGTDGRLSTDQIANPGAAQAAAPSTGTGQTGHTEEADAAQLLDPKDREAMTQRWRDIQADFVDQPRKAMQDADALVAGLMQQLAQMFSQERSQLEAQWSRGDQVSTEDLRVSLQRYRAFFERLLSV